MNFTTAGVSCALEYAVAALREKGWRHLEDADVILLPVPSLDADGSIKGGGSIDALPRDSLIIGGNLDSVKNHKKLDLLKNPLYLSENASITAHCAIREAMSRLPITLNECPILVIGWGRIGKCLVRLLRLLGANVAVAARKESDRALIAALGYTALDPAAEMDLSQFRLIYNTADAPVLPMEKQLDCRADCLKIDLASHRGIDGEDVVWARGLPNKYVPESSGRLIAQIVVKELGA